MKKTILCLLVFFGSSCLFGSERFCLTELGVGGGYARGGLEAPQDDYEVIPLFVRFGFSFKELFCWQDYCGEFQLIVSPLVSYVLDPNSGFELGVRIGLHWSHPVTDCFWVYLEAGAAPIYLTIDTREQEEDGFNFLDTFGTGFRYFFQEDKSISVGYRFRHISHADLREARNDGLDSHGLTVVLSKHY